MMKKRLWIAALAVLGMTTMTQAAEISWSSVDLTTNATEVSTNGTFLEALNFNPVGGPTASNTVINGVTFSLHTDGTTPTATYFSANSGGMSLDSHAIYSAGLVAYTGLLSNFIYHKSSDQVTLSLLEAGQQYQIQLFVGDGRAQEAATTVTMDIGKANAFTSPGLGSNSGYGLVINGVFTADAATQIFEMNKNSTKGLQLSGYQLRAIPEPATLGLVVAFGGGIVFLRRLVM
jgi:hypothetical protein